MSVIEVRILDNILPFDSTVGLSATSENPSFPASNLSNAIRAMMWKSYGFFEITSSNKYIDFKDAIAGSELTATLTVGSYTRSELIAQIEEKMAIAGSYVYTVTYASGSGKWTIASSGSEFQILWDTGTNTANSVGATLGFDTSSDDTGAVSYTGASIALHTFERLIVDLKAGYASTPVNSAVLVLDKYRGNTFSSEATITLKANHTNTWGSPAVSQALTFDEDHGVAIYRFTSDQSYRYWCVEIVDPKNPNLGVEIHKFLLGKATQLTRAYDIGYTWSRSDLSKKSRNAFGYEYSDVYAIERGYDFTYNTLDYADLETIAAIYERLGTTEPLALIIDGTEQLYDKDNVFIYGKFSGEMKAKHIVTTLFDLPVGIVEAF